MPHRDRSSPRQRGFQPTPGQSPYRHLMSNYRPAGPIQPGARRRSHWKAGLLLIACGLLVLVAINLVAQHTAADTLAVRQAERLARQTVRRKDAAFQQQLAAIFAANPGINFSVSTVSQEGGLQTYGSTQAFDAASTGKLVTAADYLHQVEAGTVNLQQRLQGQDAEDLLDRMVVDSDDDAWDTLNAFLTHAGLNQYARSIGLADYDADNNNLPSADVAILLYKLYNGHLLNTADRSLLLGYLARANYRQYIVPAVPAGDSVFHKVGFDADNLHDAAIICKGDRNLVLVIFTNGNGQYDWAGRATVLQQITRSALATYL